MEALTIDEENYNTAGDTPLHYGKNNKENIIVRILREHFLAYEKTHNIAKYKINVIRSILNCRTVELGAHKKECGYCDIHNIYYNSCKNRSCPKCSSVAKKSWLDRQLEKLLACMHYHVVFTIPDKFNALYNQHPKIFIDALFKSSNETLDILLKDNKYLGSAATGKIMTLHTWGSNMSLHPHIHCLVTDGGLSKRDNWITPKNNNYLFPVKAASILFRSNFLKRIKDAISDGTIPFDSYRDKKDARDLIQSLYGIKWNVFIKEKYEYGSGILKYLGRYVKGGSIHKDRILKYDGEFVTFTYKDYKNTPAGDKPLFRMMKVTVEDFITRFLLHIPPPRIKTVRYFGLYSPNSIKKLNLARRLLGQPELQKSIDLDDEIVDNNQDNGDPPNMDPASTIDSFNYCKNCGRLLKASNFDRDGIIAHLKKISHKPPNRIIIEIP